MDELPIKQNVSNVPNITVGDNEVVVTDKGDDADYSPAVNEDEDDEATLDEEESQDNGEGDANEMADLQNEGEMPIEELLKRYGYPCGEQAVEQRYDYASKREKSGSYTSSSEEEILSSGDLTLDKRELSGDLLGDDYARAPSVDELHSSIGTPSTSYNPPSNNLHQRLDDFYGGNYYDDDEDESDDEDYVPEETKRKEVKIGPEHQADVPDLIQPADDSADNSAQSSDRLLWTPNVDQLDEKTVESYLQQVHDLRQGSIKSACVRDDEQALKVLQEHEFDVVSALIECTLNATSPDTHGLEEQWPETDIERFEEGLTLYGKNFMLIQQHKLAHRRIGEIVYFYYKWKKSERHEAFVRRFQSEKREYLLHPETTDYMDHFLDEVEHLPQPAGLSNTNLGEAQRTEELNQTNSNATVTHETGVAPTIQSPSHLISDPFSAGGHAAGDAHRDRTSSILSGHHYYGAHGQHHHNYLQPSVSDVPVSASVSLEHANNDAAYPLTADAGQLVLNGDFSAIPNDFLAQPVLPTCDHRSPHNDSFASEGATEPADLQPPSKKPKHAE